MTDEKKHEIEIDPDVIQEAVESVEKITEAKSGGQKDEASNEQLIRLAADFDNFRKRTQKEKAELVRYANENLVREILPILDNFDRAVEHARKASDIDSIRQGVEMILSQLHSALERFGVISKNYKDTPFDPMYHEAVSHVPSEDVEPNTVMEEHQKAYFLHDRLIRPALVTVSKKPGNGEG